MAKPDNRKSGLASTILIAVLILAGLGLLLYPTVSNLWNDMHMSRAVRGYEEAVAALDAADYDHLWAEARSYNKALLSCGEERFQPTEEETEYYNTLLDVDGSGILGYIEIPKISIRLPVYHGTDDSILQFAIGHLEGSSLPTGELGTHVAVSGHTGLPSAKLFTYLTDMEIGDSFAIHVLDRTLNYIIDQIEVVDPDDMELLDIQDEESYCTLITCTPYGVNSHRLLVRGTLEGGIQNVE